MEPSLYRRSVSLNACVYQDAEEFLRGWEEVVLPVVQAFPRWTFEIRIFDNSDQPSSRVRDAVLAVPGGRYQWQGGANPKYCATINRMARATVAPRFVYVCLSHSRCASPIWLSHLLEALDAVPEGMAGHLTDGPEALPFAHIQGGVFAIRTAELQRFPFPEDLPHDYSDVIYSRQIALRGGALVDVPGIVSRSGLGTLRRQLLRNELRRGKLDFLHLARVRSRSDKERRDFELRKWESTDENRRILLGPP